MRDLDLCRRRLGVDRLAFGWPSVFVPGRVRSGVVRALRGCRSFFCQPALIVVAVGERRILRASCHRLQCQSSWRDDLDLVDQIVNGCEGRDRGEFVFGAEVVFVHVVAGRRVLRFVVVTRGCRRRGVSAGLGAGFGRRLGDARTAGLCDGAACGRCCRSRDGRSDEEGSHLTADGARHGADHIFGDSHS